MDDKLLARVRGLLAKAESTEFEPEAEALTDRAFALMAKYGIDQALLAASGEIHEEITVKIIDIGNPYGHEKALLLHVIADSAQCRSMVTRRGKDYPHTTLVGFPSDIERVELLYTNLLLQMSTQVMRQRPDTYPGAPSTRAHRVAWCAGFVGAIRRRLQAATDQAQEEAGTPGTALVLADRSALVDQKIAELFPRSHKGHSKSVVSRSYERGYSAGERADIGQSRVGARRTALSG